MASSDAVEPESITFDSKRQGEPDLRFVHYNDVYHIEAGSAEPVGGVSRFLTAMNEYRNGEKYKGQSNLITLFSGDAFNPSLESSVTKGRHMVPVLNKIGTDVACVGNHDLDFGVSQFRYLRNQCKFPWLLANVLDPALGEGVPIANCEKTLILESSNGIKIGFIGLAEREWLETVNALPPGLIYKSETATAKELVPGLREKGAEIIVAITHSREPNDHKLAEKCPPGLIDLILGGHDHFYSHTFLNGTHALRSGTDFKQLSYIEAWRKEDKHGGWDFTITRREIVRSIAEDEEAVKLVSKLTSSLKNKLEKPVGYTAAPLDGRFTTVRTKESNLGNFVCDLMRFYYDTDCALMASGTIRGDQIYPPGPLRMKDIMNCFPFEDPVVVIRITGQAVLSALENSVSLVPALEGRFPQVSNIHFEYHPAAPIGSRIRSVEVHYEPLKLEAYYKVATRGYMARGKDGFNSLLVISEGGTAEELVSEENGILISTILRQYFLSLKVLGRWHRWGPSLDRHWDGVHDKLHQGGKVKESRPVDKRRRPPMRTRHGNSKHDDASTTKPHHKPHHHMKPHLHQDYHEDAHYSDSDTDASDAELMTSLQDHEPHPQHHHLATHGDLDRDMHLARIVAKKWMRLAGIKREHVGTVESEEEEFMPGWTRGIAPRVEGRIRIVGQERKESASSDRARRSTLDL